MQVERPISTLFKIDARDPVNVALNNNALTGNAMAPGGNQRQRFANNVAFMRTEEFKRRTGMKEEEIHAHWERLIATKRPDLAQNEGHDLGAFVVNNRYNKSGPTLYLEAKDHQHNQFYGYLQSLYYKFVELAMEAGTDEKTAINTASDALKHIRVSMGEVEKRIFPQKLTDRVHRIKYIKREAARMDRNPQPGVSVFGNSLDDSITRINNFRM